MKKLCIGLLTWLAISLHGETLDGFTEEKLGITGETICIVSSFNEGDFFTVYAKSGELVWELSFKSQIVSWKNLDDETILIFSKQRNGLYYYLTNISNTDGKVLWEKTIVSPAFGQSSGLTDPS